MRLDRFFSLRIARPFSNGSHSTGVTCIPILMYHSISEDAEVGVGAYYRVVTSPAVFRQHLQLLKASGYHCVDIKAVCETLKAGTTTTEKLAVITFDDGYRDFYLNAFPALREHDFTATMFLPTAYIGKQTRQFKARDCMTWNEVRELQNAGIHFGSHTVNHPKLVGLDWPQIKTELADSKKEIENQLGCAADTFAYPFAFPETRADFVMRLDDTLRDCGYSCCATTRVGRAKAGDDLMQLKRLPANDCDDDELFRAKLDGAYDWIAALQFGVKKIKSVFLPHRSGGRNNSSGSKLHQHA